MRLLMGMNSQQVIRISVPIAVMREFPTEKSPVVSQAIFSDQAHIIDAGRGWIKIETLVDGYRGWVKKGCYHLEKQRPHASNVKVSRLSAHVYRVKDTIFGPILTLPFESLLEIAPDPLQNDERWLTVVLPDGKIAYIQHGDVSSDHRLLSLEEVCRLSLQFLGLPYTWGGRSSFGYDCSGFVQMLYRQMGYQLPRDAKDQCRWSHFVDVDLDKTRPGNLVFFGTSDGHIVHVGFCLGDDKFIHATVNENMPYIRVSSLKDSHWSGLGRLSYRAAKGIP